MKREKLEQVLSNHFSIEVKNAEPEQEWWQKAVSATVQHQQRYLNPASEGLNAWLGQRLEVILKLPYGSYRAPLFRVATSAFVILLLLGLSAGVVAAISNLTKQEQPALPGSNQITIVVNGLAQGEDARLYIGVVNSTLEIETTLLEYYIEGVGPAITIDIIPNLEDGYYLMILEVPSKYFRNPKGYFFMVDNSLIVNPTGKQAIFNLSSPPSFITQEAVGALSAPPRQPISPIERPLWQKLLEPVAIALSVIVVALVLFLILRSRLKVKS